MRKGKVYLVGAGPGDRGLITVKGLECLRRAEVVVYDLLANPNLLDEAPPGAECIYVGKSRDRHQTSQDRINALLVEKAQQGLTVVRLKGGDPYIFGRGGEEAQCLHQAGIPFEVVPGVTAGFAAAAYAGIPLTHRDFTTSLGLVTGHEKPDRETSSIDWERLATAVGTLVFYMGMTNLWLIAEKLIQHGRSSSTPVAVVRWATTPRQQTVTGTLSTIVAEVERAGLKPPAVIVVGEVVGLREQMRWFDNRPLFGKRVLVTRDHRQSGKFVNLLQEQGASALCCPMIEIAPPESWDALDAGIDQLDTTDILILTSANAVEIFFQRLQEKGQDVRALAGMTLVVAGPKTAAALEGMGVRPDLMPEEYCAEGVVAALLKSGVKGKKVFYPKAELARDLIPAELTAAGAQVMAPVAYRSLPPAASAEKLHRLLSEGQLDIVTFTSSSTVDHFAEMLGSDLHCLMRGIDIVSIGPLTSATVTGHGLEVAVEPPVYTLDGMVEAMVAFYGA